MPITTAIIQFEHSRRDWTLKVSCGAVPLFNFVFGCNNTFVDAVFRLMLANSNQDAAVPERDGHGLVKDCLDRVRKAMQVSQSDRVLQQYHDCEQLRDEYNRFLALKLLVHDVDANPPRLSPSFNIDQVRMHTHTHHTSHITHITRTLHITYTINSVPF